MRLPGRRREIQYWMSPSAGGLWRRPAKTSTDAVLAPTPRAGGLRREWVSADREGAKSALPGAQITGVRLTVRRGNAVHSRPMGDNAHRSTTSIENYETRSSRASVRRRLRVPRQVHLAQQKQTVSSSLGLNLRQKELTRIEARFLVRPTKLR